MALYQVIGSDRTSGKERRLTLEADSESDAMAKANAVGIMVAKLLPVHETPAIERNPTTGRADDVALLVFSVLIPWVGIIAGSMRLAGRDRSGVRILWAALVGFVLEGLLVGFLVMRGR